MIKKYNKILIILSLLTMNGLAMDLDDECASSLTDVSSDDIDISYEEFEFQKNLAKRYYICGTCKQVYKYEGCLKKHEAKHLTKTPKKNHPAKSLTETPDECHGCGRIFKSKLGFRDHMSKMLVDDLYDCELCDEAFPSHACLINHIRTHIGKPPHLCDDCGNKFSSIEGFLAHTRTHTGDRPFSCGTCAMTFSTESIKRRHEKNIHKIKSTKKRKKQIKNGYNTPPAKRQKKVQESSNMDNSIPGISSKSPKNTLAAKCPKNREASKSPKSAAAALPVEYESSTISIQYDDIVHETSVEQLGGGDEDVLGDFNIIRKYVS